MNGTRLMMSFKDKLLLLEEYESLLTEQELNCAIFAKEQGLDTDSLYELCDISRGALYTVKVLATLLEIPFDDLLDHVTKDAFGQSPSKYYDGVKKRTVRDNEEFLQFWEDVSY